jgi:hypothetical protein
MSRFGEDDGCVSRSTEKKRKGACGQTSMEDCGLCPSFNSKNFIYRKSVTKDGGHPINLMHQCRAICESTKLRCTRHVWEGDTRGWKNQYQQPLWCKQHAQMCDGGPGELGHMGWYKKVCDTEGLKQPELRFMNEWVMLPENKRNKYIRLRQSDPKEIAKWIEREFWYKVYEIPMSEPPPRTKDIEDAYKDSKYRDLITEYFVYLTECADRRMRNNNVCFTGEYDLHHDDYLNAIVNMINAMYQHMPVVRDNLTDMKNWLISNHADEFTRTLRLAEPRVGRIDVKLRTIKFASSEWPNRVHVICKTLNDWKNLNNVAPALYSLIYPRIEYLEDIDVDMKMPKLDVLTIVPDGEKGSYLHGPMMEYESAIQKLLFTGTIPSDIIDKRNVLGLLLFMDFWNIGVVTQDAEKIIQYLVDNRNISETVSFLSLSQAYGSNAFFIRKYMATIIESILRIRLEKIVEDYQKRIENPSKKEKKEDLEKSIYQFKKRVETIIKYVSTLQDPLPLEFFKKMINLDSTGGQHQTALVWNKVVISDLNDIVINSKKIK